jgi:signal recognition particle subunit SRP54
VFENLSARLERVLHKLGGQGRINEVVLKDSLREVRQALLEADVHVSVTRELLEAVRAKALGEEVLRSLTPGQQVIKIVRDELARLLGGGTDSSLRFSSKPPTTILLVGLQGSGKTTTAGKLGGWLKRAGRYPYLVPVDVQRPAAIEQLVRVAQTAGLPVHEHDGRRAPLAIAQEALQHARRAGFDTVLVDTAGRLHIDQALMDELRALRQALEPSEILLVADAMTGQDAVRSAREFHEALQATGLILTKLDGDARGGAVLSIRHVTGLPVKFVGTGERPGDLEPFHPERMVGRVLGMGDVLGLIERAEEVFDEGQARELERKLRKEQFTLQDFRDQLRMVRRMGPLSGLVAMLPGMSQVRDADLDPRVLTRVIAIVDSMTPGERANPRVLNGSRKRRIARGSGQPVPEINRLLKQFAQVRRMMKAVRSAPRGGRPGRLPFFGR